MKNRYLKGAHISEKKVFELLRLFSDDLNATQIAEISGISRITVNAYLKMIRNLLVEHCEEESRKKLVAMNGSALLVNGSNYVNGHNHESMHIVHRSTGNGKNGIQQEAVNGAKRKMYGITTLDSNVYAEELDDFEPEAVHEWLKKKYLPESSGHVLSRYHAIADFNSLTLYRTGIHDRLQRDDLDHFWAMLRSRMIKFRGLNSGTLLLHVKETEFRYNNRNSELFDTLLKIMNKRPLQYNRHE